MSKLRKPIKVELLKDAEDYFLKQNEKIQSKFLVAFDKTEAGYKGEWFKKLKDSDGIYEFRQVTIKSFIEFSPFGILKIKTL